MTNCGRRFWSKFAHVWKLRGQISSHANIHRWHIAQHMFLPSLSKIIVTWMVLSVGLKLSIIKRTSLKVSRQSDHQVIYHLTTRSFIHSALWSRSGMFQHNFSQIRNNNEKHIIAEFMYYVEQKCFLQKQFTNAPYAHLCNDTHDICRYLYVQ